MSSITRRTMLAGLAAGLGTALALPLTGCGPQTPSAALRMACGEEGGRYIQFGALLRTAMRARGAASVTAVNTGGSMANLTLLADGDAELAIALADAAVDSGQGEVAIGRVYQNYLQCVVLRDGPVRTIDDLAGRRISIGAVGSGSALTTGRVLATMDWDGTPNAPTRVELSLADAADALSAGDIDAFFWSGGIPTPQIDELGRIAPVRVLDLSTTLDALNVAHPGLYQSAAIPAGVYGSTAPTPAIGIPNLLLARPELPGRIARDLVDVLIEDARDLVPAGSVGVQYLTPSNLIDTSPVPLHPAAKARYRERYG